MYIDSHSHIYSNEFFNDTFEMLQRAGAAGVTTILMPAIDSETHERMFELEQTAQVRCLSMIGLHPCSVKEDYEKELKIIEQHLQQRKFVAIGETGLDFYWDVSYKEQQYRALEKQIQWALEYQLPLVIHSRNATQECIDMVAQYVPEGLRGVFHCFGGFIEEAQKIMNLGFFLGIGGVVTFKKSGLAEVIKNIGLEYVILETDAPYLAPVPHRGKRNEPAYIPLIAQKIADVLEMPVEKVAAVTTENSKKLFSL